jgi:hypothetical protein
MGSFEVECGAIRITDPCYNLSVWCSGSTPAKNGEWITRIVLSDEKDWGTRVAELHARHIDAPEPPKDLLSRKWKKLDIDVGVDSGQCGFFDAEKYEKTKEDQRRADAWYDECCDVTEPGRAGLVEEGVVSSSGFGDGSYRCFAVMKDKKAIALRLIFIGGVYDDE